MGNKDVVVNGNDDRRRQPADGVAVAGEGTADDSRGHTC